MAVMLKESGHLSGRHTEERQVWNLILSEKRHAICLHAVRWVSAHKLALKEELVDVIGERCVRMLVSVIESQ